MGTLDVGTDTSDANVTTGDIAYGKVAYTNTGRITGSVTVTDSYVRRLINYKGIGDFPTLSEIQVRGVVDLPILFRSNSEPGFQVPYNAISNVINLTADVIKKDAVVLDITGTYEGIISEQEYNNCLNTANTILGIA